MTIDVQAFRETLAAVTSIWSYPVFHRTKPRCVVELDILGVGSALLLVLPRSPGVTSSQSRRAGHQGKGVAANRCMGETDEPPCTCTSVGTYMSVHIAATLLTFMHEHNMPPTQETRQILRCLHFLLVRPLVCPLSSFGPSIEGATFTTTSQTEVVAEVPQSLASWCACGGRANVSLRLAVFVCCTLYILTHAACVGREETERGSSKLLCINHPDLGEAWTFAGWLAFLLQHRIVQASHAAVLRRRTESG